MIKNMWISLCRKRWRENPCIVTVYAIYKCLIFKFVNELIFSYITNLDLRKNVYEKHEDTVSYRTEMNERLGTAEKGKNVAFEIV